MDIDLDKNAGAGAMLDNLEEKVFYLPLVDKDGIPLPLHFLTQMQVCTSAQPCGYEKGIFFTLWLCQYRRHICVSFNNNLGLASSKNYMQ